MEKLVQHINDLVKNVNILDIDKHPLTIATYFRQQFLNVIHPFSDGNGRIGRIFTNLILLKNGYPPVFIKEVNREEYLKCFELEAKNKYEMDKFLSFYKKALNRILEYNLQGEFFREDYATIILKKILTPFPVGYVDLNSPTGSITNVIVFN